MVSSNSFIKKKSIKIVINILPFKFKIETTLLFFLDQNVFWFMNYKVAD